MKIIDNFLPKEIFDKIQKNFLGIEFPWFWCTQVVYDNECICEELDNFQMVHVLSINDEYRVEKNREYLEPLIGAITNYELKNTQNNFYSKIFLLRAKINLNQKTHKIIKSGFHIDTQVESKTAIYYLNSNDGFTEFEDGRIVESVENRIVIFDSKIRHTGTSCTNQKRRIVLNLNYVVI